MHVQSKKEIDGKMERGHEYSIFCIDFEYNAAPKSMQKVEYYF